MPTSKKSPPKKAAKKTSSAKKFKAAAEPAPNFDYSFDLKKCSVLEFVMGETPIPVPPNAGSFFVGIDDPNTPKKIRIRVVVIEDLPAASATLTLKFNGKAVTTPDLVFSGGKASFDKRITLPS